MDTQRKEIGATVDFSKATEIPSLFIAGKETFSFQDDVIGVFATQESPFTIDIGTRNALLNGNFNDVQNQTWGQGMQLLYGKVSWNETLQGNGYYITDFTVGAVIKVTRDYNTGPLFLIDALRAVPWLGAVITNKIPSYRWKAYQLFVPTRNMAYNHWIDEMASPYIEVSRTILEPLPEPPSLAIMHKEIMKNADVSKALGVFTTKMLAKGLSVTFPAAPSYGVDLCYEKTPEKVGIVSHSYKYRVHVRFWWDFTTDPDFTTDETLRLETRNLFAITAGFIIGVILAVGGVIALGIGVYNVTHTRTTHVKYGWVQNPGTGEWEWQPTESGSEEGPPDYMGWVIPIVALIGAGAAAYVVLKLVPRRSEK